MHPYLQIPVCIQNSNQETKVVDARFFPGAVEYYYPGFYEGTVVVMRNGHSFLTPLDIDDFELLLNKPCNEISNFSRS